MATMTRTVVAHDLTASIAKSTTAKTSTIAITAPAPRRSGSILSALLTQELEHVLSISSGPGPSIDVGLPHDRKVLAVIAVPPGHLVALAIMHYPDGTVSSTVC